MTISICHGDGYLRHNNRHILSNNVDKNRSRFNWVWHLPLLEEIKDKYGIKNDNEIPNSKIDTVIVESAYLRYFGKATKEYNQKQKRADRRYNDYYKHLFGCDYKSAPVGEQGARNGRKSFYELVIQIGNIHDAGFETCDADTIEVIRACLIDYVKQMMKRNPSFKVFNIALHMDEATPHLHIDYIPVADGFSRGQNVQNSLTGALSKLGFNGRSAFIDWLARERAALTDICQKRGIDIEAGVCGRKERLMVADYKEYQRQHEALRAQIDVINDKVVSAQADLDYVDRLISEVKAKVTEVMDSTFLKSKKKALEGISLSLDDAQERVKQAQVRIRPIKR